MNDRDRDYYLRRIEREAAAADVSQCEQVRSVHLELAELYSEKLRMIESRASDLPPLAAVNAR